MAEKKYNQPTKITNKDFLHTIAGLIGAGLSALTSLISPNATAAQQPIPTVAPTPTPIPYGDIIRKGFEKYGNPPIAEYTPNLVEVTQKYPFLKKNPYLLPSLSIVETSGGKNNTYKDNPFNWGTQDMPNVPYVIERVAKGISEDPRYAKFRETSRIEDLVNVYAPPNENPNFLKNLIWALSLFQEK